MSERFVTTSPDGSRDTLYERRSALSRDLLGDSETRETPRQRRAKRQPKTKPALGGATRRPIRVPELALGLVLVIGGALAASLLASKRTETVQVVAAASDLVRGHEVSAGDLVAVEMESRFAQSMTSAADAQELLGKRLAADVSAGTPIMPELVEVTPALRAGEEVVALRVEVGDVPTSIAAGDSVRIVLVPDPSVSTDTAVTEFDQPATVWDVEPPSEMNPD
ncbi:MAG: SAF domain-containing protein, partial [Actinomycetota bacterium]